MELEVLPGFAEIQIGLLSNMVENASSEGFTLGSPLPVQFVSGSNNFIDRSAEPLVDAPIHQSKCKQEEKGSRYQRQGYHRHQEAGLELRTGLLLPALGPNLNQGSEQDESEHE